MKVGFITNVRAPYRTLQINEFTNIKDIDISVYYTHKSGKDREWEFHKNIKFSEIDLKCNEIFGRDIKVNSGLWNIVKDNDVIILGSYDHPSNIIVSVICRLLSKPYILLYDGISCNRINIKERGFRKRIKEVIIKNSCAILGNGKVSEVYFTKTFSYPKERIYNQYLTVDIDYINEIVSEKYKNRKMIRDKYDLGDDEKILIFSGRLIETKNVESVIRALSKIDYENIVFLITGGGELEEELKTLANELNVKMIITGFLSSQLDLFTHYCAGDAFILPSSIYEVWGLVINEAMAVGLPVIVSNICGCSMDLVVDGVNGFIIDPNDITNISKKIQEVFLEENIDRMGIESIKLISEWNFQNSRKSLESVIIDWVDKNYQFTKERE